MTVQESRSQEAAVGRDWTVTVDQPGAVLVCTGSLSGRAVEQFALALDQLVGSSATRVHLDLTGVEDWSPLAQAVILAVARRLSLRGRELVLLGASARLHRRTLLVEVFDLVPTVDRIVTGSRSSRQPGQAAVLGAYGEGGVEPSGQAR